MNTPFQKASDCPQYPMKNEAWIAEKFAELNRAQEPYVLVTVNIKNFKYFNLKHGWEQGNGILFNIYLAMQELLEDGEYLAHSSADNYVLLLHAKMWSMKEAAALEFIQTIIMRFVNAIFAMSEKCSIHNIYASFGIYPVNHRPCNYCEALEIAELFRKEDASLKSQTFTVNYYTDKVFKEFTDKFELAKSTSSALKRGEYKVYIQPKVDLKTSKVVGGEALLRRFNEAGEQIPLSEFLPILNTEGYIRKVDWFVFETVCKEMEARINREASIVPVSFNISKDFFYDTFMCDNYIKTSRKHNIPQKYIEFELMETISLDDTGRMIEVIDMFKRAGFKCALDDFGNGYSSFGVLLNAQLDYVKLDRIFFTNPLDETNRVILKSVIDILKFLGFKIVAEGVETKEYVDCLAELGCDLVQGYYFYRPMPLDDFMLLLDKQ